MCTTVPAFDGLLHSLGVHLDTISQGQKESYKNPGVLAHACNPSTGEVEVVGDQSGT